MEKNHNKKPFFENGLQFSFKSLILVIFLVFALYILIPKLVGLQQVFNLLLKIDKFYLFLAILVEIISYCGAAWMLGIILWRLGYKVKFWDRFRIGSIAAFAIHFFPLGSFGQGAVDYYFLRKRKVASGSVLIMFILRTIICYCAFLLLFVLGLILVPTAPALSFSPKIVSGVLLLLIILGVFYMFYLYHHKKHFNKVWDKYLGKMNWIFRKVKNKTVSDERSQEIFEDIYEGIGLFGGKKRFTVLAIVAGVLYWLGDIFCLFFVLQSFGFTMHFGGLVFSYGVATLAGLISFIPGGLGVTEGILGGVLSGLGTPVSLAFTAVLVFRFFSFWIWVPFGLYSFLSLRGESGKN